MNKYVIYAWIIAIILISSVAYSLTTNEKDSPYNHIPEKNIKVYSDKIIIELNNPQWARFADTNSMDPVLDAESNSIEIKPLTYEQIHIGDIVSYKSNLYEGIIVHRVIDIGYDSEGWYATLKGDNAFFSDPERVRFEQVNGIVVAVIY